MRTTKTHPQTGGDAAHGRWTRREALKIGGTSLGVLATVGLGGHATSARAAEFSYKYANNMPATHPMNVRAKEAADRIEKATNGRVVFQIFPSNQLGSDTDMLSQVRSGAIEFFTLSGLILSTLVPAASINGIGFAFADYDAVWKAMDGDLGRHVRGEIGKSGLVAMERIWDNGFRQVTTSTKPIASPADLKGLKIRVPVSPLWTSMFKAFDASPASINFAETYSALQTKIVEGQENPLAVISTAKLYEVQKYCSLTNHMWDGFWMLANKRAWEKLPPDLQTIVARHWNDAAMAERADTATLNASLQADLAKQGLVFNQPKPEEFRDVLRKAGFYSEWKNKYGAEAWALLEKTSGSLA